VRVGEEEIGRLGEELRGVRGEILAMGESVKRMENVNWQLEIEIGKKDSEIGELGAGVEVLEKKLKDVESKTLPELRGANGVLGKANAGLEKELDDLRTRLESAKEDLGKQKQMSFKLEHIVTETKNDLGDKKDQNQNLAEEIARLLKKNETDQKSSKIEQERLIDDISDLKTQLESSANENSISGAKIVTLEEELANRGKVSLDELESLKKKLETTQQAVESAERLHDDAESRFSTEKKKTETLSEDLTALETENEKIPKLEDIKLDLESKLQTLKSQIDAKQSE
jgi:chromosome segregation ATPase